jgi:hypothetical protein
VPASPNCWTRNDHVGITKRWVRRLGPERAALVVLDDSSRQYLFRTFERLLDMPEDQLIPDPGVGRGNRAMTGAEAALLRQVNEARQWAWPHYERMIRYGAALHMVETRRPSAGEAPLGTPAWAVEAAQQVGRATASRIAGTGIRVYGDRDGLGDPLVAGEPPTEDVQIAVRTASAAILGETSPAIEAPRHQPTSTWRSTSRTGPPCAA